MEKYYLGQLESARPDWSGASYQLVELRFERQAPSLGVLHCAKTEAVQIKLSALELAEKGETRLRLIRQTSTNDWPHKGRAIGHAKRTQTVQDFNSLASLHLEQADAARKDSCPSLIALTQDGALYSIETGLPEWRAKRLLSQSEEATLMPGSLLQCRLANSHVHLLSDLAYACCRLGPNESLEPIHRYLISSDEHSHLRLVHLEAIHSNANLALLTLNNHSLRIIQQGQCLASINFEQSQTQLPVHHLTLANQSNPNEALLISRSATFVQARAFQIRSDADRPGSPPNSSDTPGRDPDQLLAREPSFEMELCWSLDLNEIDCIRAQVETWQNAAPETGEFSCAMWSTNQLCPDNCWPKFLVLAHTCHLLVYSFEQRSLLPFSVVYDRAFLSEHLITEAGPTLHSNLPPAIPTDSYQENLDIRLRPTLVHTFRLIGPNPTDALFNNLLIASGGGTNNGHHLKTGRHFPQLGLLASISNSGHLFVFKFTSSKLVSQKDSLYQRLIADSIRGSTRLLYDQVERFQNNNKQLNLDIANLESRNRSQLDNQTGDTIENLIKTELEQSRDVSQPFKLLIKLSNLIRVRRLIILSNVNSHILEPSENPAILCTHLENFANHQIETNCCLPVVIKNIDTKKMDEESDIQATNQENHQFELTHQTVPDLTVSYALIDLDCGTNQTGRISITVPIFIMDGQRGQLKVFYILSNNETDRFAESMSADQLVHQTTRYYIKTIHVKPLATYRPMLAQAHQTNEASMSCKLTGAFKHEAMIDWLNDCFHQSPIGQPKEVARGWSLVSPFTHCYIEFTCIKDGQLDLSSNDMFALDLVKKHVLKRATSQSIELQISNEMPTLRNLRYIIGQQLINLRIFSEVPDLARITANSTSLTYSSLYSHGCVNDESDGNKQDTIDWLIESLESEMKLAEFPSDFQTPDINQTCNSMRKDIELLIESSVPIRPSKSGSQNERYNSQQESIHIMRDLVCGFIIDALVDFDKMNGFKSSSETMVLMRSKLLNMLAKPSLDKRSFVDDILKYWSDCKKMKQK